MSDHEKDGKPSHSATPSKIVTGLNATIVLIGVLITGTGVFLKVGFDLVEDKVLHYLKDVLQEINTAGIEYVDVNHLDLGGILDKAAMPLIIVGIYILVVSAFGMFAAKMRLVALLIPYCILLGLGILLQIGVIVLVITQRHLLDNVIKPKLVGSISQYRGYNETNLESQTWNIAMVLLHCCGTNDYTDFRTASHWRRRLFQEGWWFELKTPMLCCRLDGKSPDDFSCAVNPSVLTSNFNKGCYSEVWSLIDTYKIIPLICIGILVAVQIILFIATVILINQIIKTKRKRLANEGVNGAGGGLVSMMGTIPNGREGPFGNCANGGIRNLAETLGGGFRFGMAGGISNADILQGYLENVRLSTSTSDDLLSQLLKGTSSNPYYTDFNAPKYFAGPSRGPIVVQLPPSPQIAASVPKFHNRTLVAIEGPKVQEHFDCDEHDAESLTLDEKRRQFARCKSDGDILSQGEEMRMTSNNRGNGAMRPRRGTMR